MEVFEMDSISDIRSKNVLLNKVPEITALFWITKVLTTGMGEVFSDFLVKTIDPVIAVALGGVGLITFLILQLSVRRYIAWIYWSTVVMVSIFGTMAADVLHIGLGIPYVISTAFFTASLAAIFVIWFVFEKTLSIHSIHTRRREFFYWATVLTTFALGTASGDMTASTWHLGYLSSGILFAVLIAVPGLMYPFLKRYEVFFFWFAYIMTRPLGASFADWVSVPGSRGGLNVGTGLVSLVLTACIIALVGYLAATGKDIVQESEMARFE